MIPCAFAGKRCYVPVVEDSNSNMKFLHLGACGRAGTSTHLGGVSTAAAGLHL